MYKRGMTKVIVFLLVLCLALISACQSKAKQEKNQEPEVPALEETPSEEKSDEKSENSEVSEVPETPVESQESEVSQVLADSAVSEINEEPTEFDKFRLENEKKNLEEINRLTNLLNDKSSDYERLLRDKTYSVQLEEAAELELKNQGYEEVEVLISENFVNIAVDFDASPAQAGAMMSAVSSMENNIRALFPARMKVVRFEPGIEINPMVTLDDIFTQDGKYAGIIKDDVGIAYCLDALKTAKFYKDENKINYGVYNFEIYLQDLPEGVYWNGRLIIKDKYGDEMYSAPFKTFQAKEGTIRFEIDTVNPSNIDEVDSIGLGMYLFTAGKGDSSMAVVANNTPDKVTALSLLTSESELLDIDLSHIFGWK